MGRKKREAENILILGLGGVGTYLAKRLVHEGYAVTAIEPDGRLIRNLDGHLDARLVQGSAMSIACWREANRRECRRAYCGDRQRCGQHAGGHDRRPLRHRPEDRARAVHGISMPGIR